MTLKQLEYFLKIAETGSFTKAAQMLNVSQPPLSYQIKLLEDELETALFIRDARGLKITEAGTYLQKEAKRILGDIDMVIEGIQKMNTEKNIELNIGTVSSINHDVLPDIIKKIENEISNVQINIFDGSSDRIQELVENKTVEIGIIREPFNHHQYKRKRIVLIDTPEGEGDYLVAVGREDLFPVRKGEEIRFDDLMTASLIIHRRFEEIITKICKEKGIKPHIISRNENIITSTDWAKHGLGIAIMPYSSALVIKDQTIIIKKIIDPVSYSNLYVIWNRDTELSETVRRIVDMF